MKNRKQYEMITDKDGRLIKYHAKPIGEPDGDAVLLAYDDEDRAIKELEKLNIEYRLSDYTEDEIDEFWKNIDLTPVNDFFSKLLKTPVALIKVEQERRNGIHRSLSDNRNIAAGLTIHKQLGHLYYWSDIHLSYRHWGGGTNGATIGNILFAEGKWQIESAQDGYERNK